MRFMSTFRTLETRDVASQDGFFKIDNPIASAAANVDGALTILAGVALVYAFVATYKLRKTPYWLSAAMLVGSSAMYIGCYILEAVWWQAMYGLSQVSEIRLIAMFYASDIMQYIGFACLATSLLSVQHLTALSSSIPSARRERLIGLGIMGFFVLLGLIEATVNGSLDQYISTHDVSRYADMSRYRAAEATDLLVDILRIAVDGCLVFSYVRLDGHHKLFRFRLLQIVAVPLLLLASLLLLSFDCAYWHLDSDGSLPSDTFIRITLAWRIVQASTELIAAGFLLSCLLKAEKLREKELVDIESHALPELTKDAV